MNYDTKRSGAYIQSLRIQHGYTQGQMAKALNMDRSYLSRIESGAKGCSVDLFIQLSEFFHISMDSLILGTERDNALEHKSMVQLKKEIAELIDRLTTLQANLKDGGCVQWSRECVYRSLFSGSRALYNITKVKAPAP